MNKLSLNDFKTEDLDIKYLESLTKINPTTIIDPENNLNNKLKELLNSSFNIELLTTSFFDNIKETREKTTTISDIPLSDLSDDAKILFTLSFSSLLGSLHPSKYNYKDYISNLSQIDKSDIPELYEQVIHEKNSAVKNSNKMATIHSDDSFRTITPEIITLFGLNINSTGGDSLIWKNIDIIEQLSENAIKILSANFPFSQNTEKGPIIEEMPIILDTKLRYRPDRLDTNLLTTYQKEVLTELRNVINNTAKYELSPLETNQARFMSNNQILHSRNPYNGTRNLLKTRIYDTEIN